MVAEQEIEVPLSEPALWLPGVRLFLMMEWLRLLGVRLHVSDDGMVEAVGSEAVSDDGVVEAAGSEAACV